MLLKIKVEWILTIFDYLFTLLDFQDYFVDNIGSLILHIQRYLILKIGNKGIFFCLQRKLSEEVKKI